jgi:hypothetical protein
VRCLSMLTIGLLGLTLAACGSGSSSSAREGPPSDAEVKESVLQQDSSRFGRPTSASCHGTAPEHWTCRVVFRNHHRGTTRVTWYARQRVLGLASSEP